MRRRRCPSSRCCSPKSDLIRTFGEAGLLSTVIALVAVLILVPLLGAAAGARREQARRGQAEGADTGVEALRRFCAWIADPHGQPSRALQPRSASWSWRASALVYAHLEPRYRLADQVPDKEQAVAGQRQARRQADRRQPDRRAGRVPDGRRRSIRPRRSTSSPRSTRTVEKQAGRRQRLVARDAAPLARREGGQDRRRDAASNMSTSCRTISSRRFIDEEQDAVLVSGRIPDKDASQLLPVVDELDTALDAVREAASRLHDRGHRPRRDRGAQQRRA